MPSPDRAEQLVDELYELDPIYKIGLESLYGYGERLFAHMEARDVRHFIDAKLHDIPRTAAAAAKALIRHGTHILNVHALGGAGMIRATVEAARERAADLHMTPPHVFAVTILTSMDDRDLAQVGLHGDALENALRLARLARDAGCSGVVCSVHESPAIKAALGEHFLTLTPGIRPSGSPAADQKRAATPAQAVHARADYIVVGRPITQSQTPLAAARALQHELHSDG